MCLCSRVKEDGSIYEISCVECFKVGDVNCCRNIFQRLIFNKGSREAYISGSFKDDWCCDIAKSIPTTHGIVLGLINHLMIMSHLVMSKL